MNREDKDISLDSSILPERKSLRISVPFSDLRYFYKPGDSALTYRFVYRVNIWNDSKTSVKLVARKWVAADVESRLHIIEAEKVFNSCPILPANGVFAYGGMQDFQCCPRSVELRIAGVDQLLAPFISSPYSFSHKQLTPYPLTDID